MVAVADFSRLVSSIYEAAVTPQHWELAIRDMQGALGGTGGSLLRGDGAVWSFHDSTIPPAAMLSYSDYYHGSDYVLAAMRTADVGLVQTGPQVVVPNRDPEFYADWMRPNELEDGLFVRLTGEPQPTCFVIASSKVGFDSADRVALFSGLVGHLQQALRTADRLASLAHSVIEMAGALEVVRHGVVVVACESMVVNLNSAAENIFRDDDGLCCVAGRIVATSPHCDQQLHVAIRDALVGDDSSVRTGGSFICDRPSGKRPYVVHVLPSHQRADNLAAGRPMGLVLIVDPEDELEPASDLLRRLFNLTEAEAEIALHMVRGADLKQVAEDLSVSLATVRTHLHHVFDKTQTHRQAELVRLLLALCP